MWNVEWKFPSLLSYHKTLFWTPDVFFLRKKKDIIYNVFGFRLFQRLLFSFFLIYFNEIKSTNICSFEHIKTNITKLHWFSNSHSSFIIFPSVTYRRRPDDLIHVVNFVVMHCQNLYHLRLLRFHITFYFFIYTSFPLSSSSHHSNFLCLYLLLTSFFESSKNYSL